jgi:hypothetical protein
MDAGAFIRAYAPAPDPKELEARQDGSFTHEHFNDRQLFFSLTMNLE